MKKFRRRSKTFALPALAAAMPWITAGGTAVGAVTGVKGAMDSSEANEIQRQMAKQQAVNDYKAQALEKQKIEATNKLAESIQSNPAAANNPAMANASTAVGQDLTTKAYSEKPRRKLFGLGSLVKNITGFSKSYIPKTNAGLIKQQWDNAKSPLGAGFALFDAGGGTMSMIGNSRNKANLKDQLANMTKQTANLESQTSSFVNNLNTATNSFQTKAYSDNSHQSNIKFRQKNYANILARAVNGFNRSSAGKFVKGTGKIAGDMLWDHRNKIITGVAGGLGMAAIHYGVNKGIQHNMEKNGIDMNAIRDMQKEQQQQYGSQQYQQQLYSDANPNFTLDKFGNPEFTAKTSMGRFGQAAKKYGGEAFGPMSLVMSTAFELPTVTGYMGEKDQLKALSDMARARKGLTPLPGRQQPRANQPRPIPNQQLVNSQQPQPNPQFRQKMQSNIDEQRMYGLGLGTWANKMKYNVKTHGVMNSFLNWADKGMLGGGQGRKGVENFGNRFINYGKKYNSQALQKTGDWIKNHPKTVMTGSLAAAGYTMGKTMGIGEDLFNKPMKAIDPNAYAYDEYKEQQIQ
jgi:hypothetical protein